MSHRIEKLNELIAKELGRIFIRDIELPVGVLVTVTNVQATPDLKLAKIWVSVLPETKNKPILEFLNKKNALLRKFLAKKIKIKFMPEIRFYYDKTEAEAETVERLLDEIKKD